MGFQLVSRPGSGYISVMLIFRQLMGALAAVVVLAACEQTRERTAPVTADLGGVEAGLARFIGKRLADARSQPSSGLMRGRLGMAYEANGFKDAAADSYAQAHALDEDDFRWPYFQAHVLAAQGDIEGALKSGAQAIALDPDYAPARLWVASWHLEAGEITEAEAEYELVLERAGTEVGLNAAHVGLARVSLRKGDADGAIQRLEMNLVGSAQPYVRGLLIRAYRQAGKPTDLTPPIETAPMTWPDPQRDELQLYLRGFSGHLVQAEALIEAGEALDAIDLLERMREERPDDRTVLNNLAVALLTADRAEEARRILEEARGEHDNFHLLHFNLGGIYESQGDVERAIEHFGRAIDLQPGLLAAHERRIALLMGQQRFRDALVAITAARNQGRVHPDVLFYAGVIKGTAGEWTAAAEHFREVLELNPEHRRAQLFLARTHAEAGQFAAAEAALARAASIGVAESQIRHARGRMNTLRDAGP